MTRTQGSEIHINGNILRFAAGLLEMEYKPSELAEEIHVNVKTIYRSYLHGGLPHRRDDHGNIWIVGTKFFAWARAVREKSKSSRQTYHGMRKDQAYCMHCNRVVRYENVYARKPLTGNRILVSAKCSVCKGSLARILKGPPK